MHRSREIKRIISVVRREERRRLPAKAAVVATGVGRARETSRLLAESFVGSVRREGDARERDLEWGSCVICQ